MASSSVPDRHAPDPADLVLRALDRYRAQRQGEADDGVECLLTRAAQMAAGAEEPGRRRVELLDRMVEAGVDAELAGTAYDIAVEEGVDPAFALEVVRCGLAVCEPAGEEAADAPAVESYPQEWLEASPPADEARRERRLRSTFRRLRRLLSERQTPEEALVAFVDEPDVGDCGY